jgi:hypothetical protein
MYFRRIRKGMTPVETLNRRLADALGSIGCHLPRFCWKRSTELFWYYRDNAHSDFQRQCWADRIGVCWLLCQWRVPTGCDVSTGTQYELTEQMWFRMFRGSIPFPARGEYVAHPETQVPRGHEPTAELTQNYIWALDKQMQATYREKLTECKADLDAHHDAHWKRQYDEMADDWPAFGNAAPGTRGGFLSFGGI